MLVVTSIRKLRYGFLFAFRIAIWSYFSRFNTIHERDGHLASHRTIAKASLVYSIALKTMEKLRWQSQSDRATLRVIEYFA